MLAKHVSVAVLACSAPWTGAALAQSRTEALSVPAPIRDAGVLHVATGGWTRALDAGAPAKVIFNNDAPSGFFGPMSHPMQWTMNGRIPGTQDPDLPNAKSDAYRVTAFQVGYCFSDIAANNVQRYRFYAGWPPCSPLTGLTPAAVLTVGDLPGSSAAGITSCWVVTLDLGGTSLAFSMPAEGESSYDGDWNLDNFGFTFEMIPAVVQGFMGPLLNGDPDAFPAGDGTYFQNPGATGSGLDSLDHFWLIDPSQQVQDGCHWFGGYVHGHPFAAWWLQIRGENEELETNCTRYCQANPSSLGVPAAITSPGACEPIAGALALRAEPVPDQFGLFFRASDQARVAFGNGFLCAVGDIVRGPLLVASGNVAESTLDVDALAFGASAHLQYWFRDPAGGGASFNLSDALTYTRQR